MIVVVTGTDHRNGSPDFPAPILVYKPLASSLTQFDNLTMVLPHHTPYVTPQILHKHYAQAHDSEQFGTCKLNVQLIHAAL